MKVAKNRKKEKFWWIVIRTQPKSSSELEESLVKRVFHRCLVISNLKREGLSIFLSSRDRLFQSR